MTLDHLEHTPAKITYAFFLFKEWGTDPSVNGNWPCFISSEPDSPDDCITLYDYTGQDDGRLMHGNLIQHPALQIRIRSNDYATGYVKADEIMNNIAEVGNSVISVGSNSYMIVCYSKIKPINYLGRQVAVRGRCLFSINCLVCIDRLS